MNKRPAHYNGRDADKIALLKQGRIPIYEPGLDHLVQKNVQAGRLAFTTDIGEGVAHGLFQFIAVGTPPDENRSAELTKYAANAMLATKISFMNELANLAERLGADIENVRIGIGADPRIGYPFISPGCGYGGSCLPKDVKALERTARDVDYSAQLLQAVEAVNERQKHLLFDKITRHFGGKLAGRTIALWGLAF